MIYVLFTYPYVYILMFVCVSMCAPALVCYTIMHVYELTHHLGKMSLWENSCEVHPSNPSKSNWRKMEVDLTTVTQAHKHFPHVIHTHTHTHTWYTHIHRITRYQVSHEEILLDRGKKVNPILLFFPPSSAIMLISMTYDDRILQTMCIGGQKVNLYSYFPPSSPIMLISMTYDDRTPKTMCKSEVCFWI